MNGTVNQLVAVLLALVLLGDAFALGYFARDHSVPSAQAAASATEEKIIGIMPVGTGLDALNADLANGWRVKDTYLGSNYSGTFRVYHLTRSR